MRSFVSGFARALEENQGRKGRMEHIEGSEDEWEGWDVPPASEAYLSRLEDTVEEEEGERLRTDVAKERIVPKDWSEVLVQARRLGAWTQAVRRLADALALARTCTDLVEMSLEKNARLEGRASEAAEEARSSRSGWASSAWKDVVHRVAEVVAPLPDPDVSPTLRLLFDDSCPRPRSLVVELDNGKRITTMLRVGGAPMRGFVAQAALLVASQPRASDMASFWLEVADAIRRRWNTKTYIPRVQKKVEVIELCACSLHQHLEMINGCVWRSRFHAKKDPLLQAMEDTEDAPGTGQTFRETELKLLRNGATLRAPQTQPPPLLSSDEMQEAQRLQQGGSIGLGCAQLRADMQAFKSCNEGCTLSDFVRWYSPADWEEGPTTASNEADGSPCPTLETLIDETYVSPGNERNEASKRSVSGRLSARMSAEGSLWQQLFDTATPIPASAQTPLMDSTRSGEAAVQSLCEVAPSDLFEQLFVVAASSAQLEGLVLSLSLEEHGAGDACVQMSESFGAWLSTTCARGMGPAKVDRLCKETERVTGRISEELHRIAPSA